MCSTIRNAAHNCRYIYEPQQRGTRGALRDLSAEYVTRREYEELMQRFDELEKGS